MEESGSTMENTTTGTCFNFTSDPFFIGVISTTVSLLSLLANIYVIFLIVANKKYVVMPQRIILYATVVAAFYCITIAAGSGVGYFTTSGRSLPGFSTYCMLSGFFHHIAAWMLLGAGWVAVVSIYLKVVLGKDTKKYKYLYIAVIMLLPMLTCWIPFINLTYGDIGPWCWIKIINNDNECSINTFGLVLQFATWYIPALVSLLIMTIMCRFILRHIRETSYFGNHNQTEQQLQQTLKKEVKKLLFIYPIIYIVIIVLSAIISIIQVIYVQNNRSFLVPLWTISAVLVPAQGALIPILLGFDWETLKQMVHHKTCAYCRESRISEYEVEQHGLSISYSTAMDKAFTNTAVVPQLKEKLINQTIQNSTV